MITKKETNPKEACGLKKPPMSVVPMPVLFELGLAMTEGAYKYERHNFRITGIRASVYFDALWRHIAAWWEGEDIDPQSGLPHVVKAMACLCVLRDAQIQGKFEDDRPPRSPEGWLEGVQALLTALNERIPEDQREPAWTQKRVDAGTLD